MWTKPIMKPLIAASILSADFTALGEAIQQAEAGGADWIHIDVMDGHFVPNLSMGPRVVEACRRVSELPLDVHLMIEDPDRLIPAYADAGASGLTVHVEACPHLHRTIELITELDCRAGVAINPATPTSHLAEVLDQADLLLVMTVNPGYAGQSFISTTMRKVAALAAAREQSGWEYRIQVDGGISPSTAPTALHAGADVFVAASAIFQHPEGPKAGVRALRQALRPVPG